MKKRLFDDEEIAEYLGVSIWVVHSWVKSGKIPHVEIGKFTKFDLRVIDEWILENSVPVGVKEGALRVEDIDLSEEGQTDRKKPCSICKEPKRLEKFYEDKRCKDGRVAKCKACMSKEAQERWKKQKERRKAARKGETRKIRGGEIVDEAGEERARKALAEKRKAAFAGK